MKKIYIGILFLFLLVSGAAFAAEIPERLTEAIKIQVLLDRANFSSGEIDGSVGPRTKKTLSAYQQEHDLDVTGEPDEATVASLQAENQVEPLITYTITAQDVKGPFLERIPEDRMEQAKLDHMGYTSPLDALGEKFHSNPKLLKKLNPTAKFSADEEILVPNVLDESPGEEETQTQTSTAQKEENSKTQQVSRKENAQNAKKDIRIVVSTEDSALTVEDSSGNILLYAPVTVGSEHDPLPTGQWEVTGVSRDPVFNYNPELFWDADPSHSKAQIQPGPNNPVGIAWIDINKEHYGIHGSPEPSTIGKKESHGCVRLTNWDVEKLLAYAKPKTKVLFK
jgi:lipoprotein-anchoring transpeptidase ErfK/SrfK